MPKYAASIPGDLFSGSEMTYRIRTEGYSLYSVGWNGTDDNASYEGGGFKSDDFGVRMYHAKE